MPAPKHLEEKELKTVTIPDIPSVVDFKDLGDPQKGYLIGDKGSAILKRATEGLLIGRYSKKDIRERILKLKNPKITKKELRKALPYLPGIIIEDNQVNAVYRGKTKAFGKGAFGKVKAAFDINTKQWTALKVQAGDKMDIYRQEEKNIKALNKGQGTLISRTKDLSSEQHNLVMEYAEGIQLSQFLLDHRNTLSARVLLDISIQVVNEINKIHEKGFVHCDIKLDNMIYDPVSGKVSIVDFGFAAELTENPLYEFKKSPTPPYLMPREIYIEQKSEGLKCSFLDANGKRQDAYFASHLLPETLRNMPIDTMIMPENAAMILKELSPLLPSNCLYLEKVFLHNKRMGTEDYIAQEIVSSHYYDRFKNYEYSKKTDSYAVGQVLKQIWGHDIYESKEHGVVNLTHHFERGDNVLFTIEDNLKSPNQGLRTPLPDVAEKIRQYRSNFLHLYPRVTAVLNVADYEKANKEGKEAFIAALKTVDMVVLVDGTEKNPLSYAHLRRELMGKGVIVDKEVIVSNDPQAIAHRIKSAPANKDIISNIYYLHPEKTKAIHTAVTGMEHITVYANKNDYVNEINENAAKVTDADLETTSQKLKRSLREFLERNSAEINNKNQVISNTGKPVNKSIADRVALLNRNIESIEGYKNDKEHRITYVKLFDDLRKLEKDIVQNKSSFRLKFKPERTLLSVKEIRGDIKYRAADKRATDLNKKVEEINEQEKRPANR